MRYIFSDFYLLLPELHKYVQNKIKNDTWKDVIQDTLLYLWIKFDSIIIFNLKGLLFNTANFFIYKQFNISKIQYDNIEICSHLSDKDQHYFPINYWNSNEIDDQLLNNLMTIKKTLYEPFELQLHGKSIKEISRHLNINEGTVKTRIKRAKEYLKQNL